MGDSQPGRKDDKPPVPMDLGAEQGVLGGILVHGGESVAMVSSLLNAEDFYERRHGLVYSAALMLWDRGEPVDEITVTGYLHDQCHLEAVGGPAFLAALSDLILSPAHVEHYARVVRGKAALRRVVAAAEHIIHQAGRAHDADQALADAQARIAQAVQSGHLGAVLSTRDVLGPVFAAYQDRRDNGGRDDRALPTGFPSLDGVIGGLRPGKLILPAGRPGMGKTCWMLNLSANVSLRQRKTVLFATAEQPPAEMVDWLVCCEGQVNTQAWASGKTTGAEERSAMARREDLERAPLYWLKVREKGSRALRSIMSHAQYLRTSNGLALLVVDYIQKIARSTKHEDISEISSGLKDAAMELEIPVVAAAQLSRTIDDRDDKRPKLNDLKGSGSLEEDADMVLSFFRPAYYNHVPDDGSVKVGILKHRGGPTGSIELRFDKDCVRFWDEAASQQGGLF